MRRNDDAPSSSHERDDRYFCLDNEWYFTTREGVVMGPYDSQAHATKCVDEYIEFIQKAKSPVINILKRDKLSAFSASD